MSNKCVLGSIVLSCTLVIHSRFYQCHCHNYNPPPLVPLSWRMDDRKRERENVSRSRINALRPNAQRDLFTVFFGGQGSEYSPEQGIFARWNWILRSDFAPLFKFWPKYQEPFYLRIVAFLATITSTSTTHPLSIFLSTYAPRGEEVVAPKSFKSQHPAVPVKPSKWTEWYSVWMDFEMALLL